MTIVDNRWQKAAIGVRARAWVWLAIALCKLRVVGMVTFTAVAAMAVAARGDLVLTHLSLLALAGTLAGAGAGMLNHYLDRDVDAVMTRTRGRPLPSGQVEPLPVLVLGTTLVLVGTYLATWLGVAVALLTLTAAVTYVLVYTRWLKRQTPWNVVIGGWTGSCAVLAGWAAAGGGLPLTAWILAAVVFFWTPPHFWAFAIANENDYRGAGIPMLPIVAGARSTAAAVVVGALLTTAVSLVPYVVGAWGLTYMGIALLAGGTFVGGSIWLWRQPSAARAQVVYRLSSIYLLLLFVGLLADALAQ